MSDSRGPWPLAGTVKPYRRHLFACTGRRGWPARIEEDEGLLGRMARAVRELREEGGDPAKLTATDEPTDGPGLDLLVFPDSLRYRGVDEAGWAAIERDHVAGGAPSASVPHEPLAGRWVFVCVHGERDDRCGECGPPVLEALAREVAAAGLDDVRVRATSHVGGHKYAGNVIVYPEGVWYGYVGPSDTPRLVREHLAGGAVLEDLHRGSMAAP